MNPIRKLKRTKEEQHQKEIRKTYNKKPKQICPKCHKKSLFMTTNNGEVFCIRCDKRIK